MNNKLNYNSEEYIFKNTILEDTQEFWLGRMLHILNKFPVDFIDRVLTKDVDAIYMLYDFDEMIKYVSLLDDNTLLEDIENFPSSRRQLHWLFILRNLTFLITVEINRNPINYLDITTAEKVHSLIKNKYPNYDKLDVWFYGL